MPWTGSPSTDEHDAIRAMVGDTDPAKPLLADDVYNLIVSHEKSLNARAAMAADALAGRYAREMTKRVGSLWREAKTLYQHYRDLAQWYRLETARRGAPIPFAGGVSVIDQELRREDSSIVQPSFTVGMQDSIELPVEAGSGEEC